MKARGRTRELLIIIGELQDKIGMARQYHYADTDPDGFVKAQNLLDDAFNLCIKTTGKYDPISNRSSNAIGRCLVKNDCNQFKREGITSNCIGCGSLKRRKGGDDNGTEIQRIHDERDSRRPL